MESEVESHMLVYSQEDKCALVHFKEKAEENVTPSDETKMMNTDPNKLLREKPFLLSWQGKCIAPKWKQDLSREGNCAFTIFKGQVNRNERPLEWFCSSEPGTQQMLQEAAFPL